MIKCVTNEPRGRIIACTELTAPLYSEDKQLLLQNKKKCKEFTLRAVNRKKMRKISLLKAPDVVWVISPYYYTTVMFLDRIVRS